MRSGPPGGSAEVVEGSGMEVDGAAERVAQAQARAGLDPDFRLNHQQMY
jgi:hypothetical protein